MFFNDQVLSILTTPEPSNIDELKCVGVKLRAFARSARPTQLAATNNISRPSVKFYHHPEETGKIR